MNSTPQVVRYIRRGCAVPSLQCMTINFWKNPGIIALFDHDGIILAQEEPIHTGSRLLRVNWRGDEFAMLSGNTLLLREVETAQGK